MSIDRKDLNKKIKALSRSTNEKLTIIEYLAKRNKDAEFQDIANELPTVKKSTIYSYLKQLENAGYIKSTKFIKSNKYSLITSNLSISFVDKPPIIRPTIGDVKNPKKGEWNKQIIQNSLIRVLSLDSKTAKEVMDETTELIYKTGLTSLNKSTIRYLICDVLYNKNLKEASYNYVPLGVPKESLKDYLFEQHYNGVHRRNVGEYMTKIYMTRQIPHNIFEFMKLSKTFFYIHGIENLLNPLNVHHDLRLLFLNGLNVKNHMSRPPRHIDVALSQIIGLLEFANNDCSRTQTLPHLNYYLSPYIKKEKMDYENKVQLLDGFIKNLFRSFVTRQRDYIYSAIQLDFDSVGIENQNVVIGGKTEDETYASHKDNAREIFSAFLDAYSKGYESNTYRYPKIFIGLKNDSVEEFLSDDKIIANLYKIVTKPDIESIYILNRNSDVGYLPDLTRIESLEEFRSTGCLLAVSLNVSDFEDDIYKEGVEAIASKLEESLDYIGQLAIWKKKILIEKMKKNEFEIIGSNWRSISPESYFNIENASVCVRLFGINKFIQKLGNMNEEDDIRDVEQFINMLNIKIEELKNITNINNFFLAQTPSKSDVTRFFNKKGPDNISFFSPVIFHNDRDSFEKRIEREAKIQKLLPGGSVTRIFYKPEKYSKDNFKEDIRLCFDKGIELMNFRDYYSI